MSRKVFISILGTNYYIPTRYYFGKEPKGDETINHFVQEVTMRHLCSNWSDSDAAYIFVTRDARTKNWDHPAQTEHKDEAYTGLSEVIRRLNFPFKTEAVDISDGFSEAEIWNIFETVFHKLKDGDQLYFDITHSFRTLPMLVMVLINYAKVLKKVKVEKIYYGAFEKLGPAYKVKNIPIDRRFVPVLDITAFSELQDWTSASNAFIRFGNADMLSEVTSREIDPILKNTQGKNKNARHLKAFSKQLQHFTKLFISNRGFNIYQGEIARNLKNTIKEVKTEAFITPLNPLLDLVNKRLDRLNELDSVENGFRAVKWCLDSKLIQQAYSMLRESVITYLLFKIFPRNFTSLINDADKRELVSAALKIISDKIPEDQWLDKAKENREFVIAIIENDVVKSVYKKYSSLGDYRNDIMHAGFRPNTKKAEVLIQKIEKSFYDITSALKINI